MALSIIELSDLEEKIIKRLSEEITAILSKLLMQRKVLPAYRVR